MLVVHSVRGTVVRLGTNRGKQRDILLDPGHCCTRQTEYSPRYTGVIVGRCRHGYALGTCQQLACEGMLIPLRSTGQQILDAVASITVPCVTLEVTP